MAESVEDKYERISYNKFIARLNKAKITDDKRIEDYVYRVTSISSTEIKEQEIKKILSELGYDDDEFDKLVEEIEEEIRQESEEETPVLVTLQKKFDDGVPEIKWRVQNIVPERGSVVFGGESGSYKSWTAMHLAMACASGSKFLEHFETKQCAVIYIDEENGDIALVSRMHKLKVGHNLLDIKFNNLYLSIFRNVKLDDKNHSEILQTWISEYNIKLIIIDSMVRCMVGDEDRASDVRVIFDTIKPILRNSKEIAFVFIHHTTKGRGRDINKLRGSGDFRAAADVILMFESGRNDPQFTNVDMAKNRHIDRSLYTNFAIKATNTIEDNLRLTYIEKSPDEEKAVEACYKDLEKWFEDDNIVKFRSSHAVKAMKQHQHSKSSVNAALKQLKKDSVITKPKQGHWQCKTTGNIEDSS